MADLAQTAHRLRMTRDRLGLSREDVEAATKVPAPTLKNWENNRFGNRGPTCLSLLQIAKLYSVSIDWLLGLTDDDLPLPAGHVIVDMALVRRIEKATSLTQLRDRDEPIVWAADIPEFRKVFPPEDAEFQELEKQVQAKLKELGEEE